MKLSLRLAVALSLLAGTGPVKAEDGGISHSTFDVRAHDPRVLADRSWGRLDPDSLPWNDDPKAFFYVRPVESSWLEAGAAAVGRELQRLKVAGLDLEGQSAVNDATLKALVAPFAGKGLKLIRLRGTSVTAAGVAALSSFQSLQILSLPDSVNDAAFAKLPFGSLEELALNKSKVTAAGLKSLTKARGLRRLDFGSVAVTPEALASLRGIRLDQLVVNGSVSDALVPSLVRFRTLGLLDLSQSRVTDKGLAALRALPVLHTLFVPAGCTDKALESVGKIKSLVRLDLSGASLSDTSLRQLEPLTNLKELVLVGTGITDEGLSHLGTLKQLQVLDLTGTSVTAAGLQRLRQLQSLEVVALPGKSAMRVKDLKSFETASRLRSVYVNGKPLPSNAIAYARGTTKATSGLAFSLGEGQSPAKEGDSLEIIALADARPAFKISGLRGIHERESALDHVMTGVETPKIEKQTDTQENFIGEFTVDSVGGKR